MSQIGASELGSGFSMVGHNSIDILFQIPKRGPRLVSLFVYLKRRAVFHGQKHIPKIKLGNLIRPLKIGEVFVTQTNLAKTFGVSPRTIARDLNDIVRFLNGVTKITIETCDSVRTGGTIVTFHEQHERLTRSKKARRDETNSTLSSSDDFRDPNILDYDAVKNFTEVSDADATLTSGRLKSLGSKGLQDGCDDLADEDDRTIEYQKNKKYIYNNLTDTNVSSVQFKHIHETFKKYFPHCILNKSTLSLHLKSMSSDEIQHFSNLIPKVASDLLMSTAVRGVGSILNYPKLKKQADQWRAKISSYIFSATKKDDLDAVLESVRTSLIDVSGKYQPTKSITLEDVSKYFAPQIEIWKSNRDSLSETSFSSNNSCINLTPETNVTDNLKPDMSLEHYINQYSIEEFLSRLNSSRSIRPSQKKILYSLTCKKDIIKAIKNDSDLFHIFNRTFINRV